MQLLCLVVRQRFIQPQRATAAKSQSCSVPAEDNERVFAQCLLARLECSARAGGNRVHTVGKAAWQSCQRLQIVKLEDTVVCLQDDAFQRCWKLRTSLGATNLNAVFAVPDGIADNQPAGPASPRLPACLESLCTPASQLQEDRGKPFELRALSEGMRLALSNWIHQLISTSWSRLHVKTEVAAAS